MQSKLTLRLEDELIRRAKRYARKEGTSLSRLVANYFSALDRKGSAAAPGEDLPPLTRSLWGAAEGADAEGYGDYLEEKHR
jgi:hypothetical protein